MRSGIVLSPPGDFLSSSVASRTQARKRQLIPRRETALLRAANYD
jgi:hypothetical protein